ncbi:8-oxo-dGTP diphosphatase [Novimethylophilus kurashikiensis]|uniref:8-oxo-dGTP diphosphatase n=1 Tax=Novimethylophilus kurashikiensis TaxID=1825523 RepID=A0A2R5F4E1_9PROT|nr:Nudix family hydrolase [Novimethylophilus kurashikiensis]GBG13277.1 8-oxo-dGTP diphosphatase [Novimethylophilus kurashikiensis]
MAEIVEAAVAVILREDGKVLLGQRPEGKPWSGWWEFPGGKIEAGETPFHALQRELQEEIGIEAEVAHPWITRVFSYPDRTVKLRFFTVRRWHREPHGKENQQLSWELPAAVNVSPMLPANTPVLDALQLPTAYAITNLAEMGEAAFFAALDHALEQGLRLVQVREKQLSSDELERFSREVVRRCAVVGARVVINGDIELARKIGAAGVHLPTAQLMSLEAKPEGMLCGASCHNREELERASELGLDYALLASVNATKTHPDTQPLGWDRFAELIRELPMPVYALGGLAKSDMDTAWEHGAHGVAMLRGIWR